MAIDAAAWSPRSHQQVVKSSKGWTVSYKDALRLLQKKPKSTGQEYQEEWACGNHDSEPFFEKMNTSFEEVERVRQQCRAAAKSAFQRSQEERPRIERFRENVAMAQQVSDISRNSLAQPTHNVDPRPESLSTRGITPRGELPSYLGHLHVPAGVQLPAVHKGSSLLTQEVWSLPDAANNSAARLQAGASDAPAALALDLVSNKASGAAHRTASAGSTVRSVRDLPDHVRIGPVAETPPRGFGGAGEADPDGASSEGGFSSCQTSTEDGWPPKPPIMKFKGLQQFSELFEPADEFSDVAKQNKSRSDQLFQQKGEGKLLTDMVVAWFNKRFAMEVKTEFEFEVSFPVMVLTIMDAIYPTKVPWYRVDWRIHYKMAFQRNFQVLDKIWQQVSMDKARGFRAIDTSLRFEDMETASMKDRLSFLKLMKRWFDARIHSAPPYDPIRRRHEFVHSCYVHGHTVEFPPWITFDKDDKKVREFPSKSQYDAMPEFKRLIWFMGSPEIQQM